MKWWHGSLIISVWNLPVSQHPLNEMTFNSSVRTVWSPCTLACSRDEMLLEPRLQEAQDSCEIERCQKKTLTLQPWLPLMHDENQPVRTSISTTTITGSSQAFQEFYTSPTCGWQYLVFMLLKRTFYWKSIFSQNFVKRTSSNGELLVPPFTVSITVRIMGSDDSGGLSSLCHKVLADLGFQWIKYK